MADSAEDIVARRRQARGDGGEEGDEADKEKYLVTVHRKGEEEEHNLWIDHSLREAEYSAKETADAENDGTEVRVYRLDNPIKRYVKHVVVITEIEEIEGEVRE